MTTTTTLAAHRRAEDADAAFRAGVSGELLPFCAGLCAGARAPLLRVGHKLWAALDCLLCAVGGALFFQKSARCWCWTGR